MLPPFRKTRAIRNSASFTSDSFVSVDRLRTDNWHLAVYSTFDDSHFRHGFGGADGTVLRKLSQCVSQSLARRRKCRHAAFALLQLRSNAGVVGEHSGCKLVVSSWPLPNLQCQDQLALSAGGVLDRRALGFRRLATHVEGCCRHFRRTSVL